MNAPRGLRASRNGEHGHVRAAWSWLLLGIFCAVAHAQSPTFDGNATWTWEGSADGGLTWSGGLLVVPQGQASIRVRSSCAFPAGDARYLGQADMDATVTGLNGAGPHDSVTNVARRLNPALATGVMRIGNIIKLDDPLDFGLPGMGSGWLYTNQPSPASTAYHDLSNPIGDVVDFTLMLDGTPGDREVGAVFRTYPPPWGHRQIIIDWRHYPYTPNCPTLTQEPLTIHVLPAPGAWAMVLAALVGRRRRRATGPGAGPASWGSLPR